LGRTFLLARVLGFGFGFGFGFVSFFHCVVRLSNFSQADHPMLSFTAIVSEWPAERSNAAQGLT
jgi:hypothetical protein